MAEHKISLSWTDGGKPFTYESYPREHEITYKTDQVVTTSAAPAYRAATFPMPIWWTPTCVTAKPTAWTSPAPSCRDVLPRHWPPRPDSKIKPRPSSRFWRG